MSEPSRRRVAIPTEPEGATERRGCLRIAAVLGILIGIPAGVLGVPAALNFLFDEATVALGGVYDDTAVVIRIESVEVDEEARSVAIALGIEAKETHTFDAGGAELELANGDRLPPAALDGERTRQLIEGTRVLLTLTFALAEGQPLEPHVFHLEDPDVRFELTETEE